LRDDAALLAKGVLNCVPMGYLLCGPVGTGKSFLAMCAAGEIGIPCVMLKNFRSKYVGETEGNLERVLSVLRAMGPVMVVVDEADTALGDRDNEGDAGTSSRVFGMIATQMGDTRYRGRILWMLLTARPDLLAIDMKRQGRFGLCVPLFPAQGPDDVVELFNTVARSKNISLNETILDYIRENLGARPLTGSDVESILIRAKERAVLDKRDADVQRQRFVLVETVQRRPLGLGHELTLGVVERGQNGFVHLRLASLGCSRRVSNYAVGCISRRWPSGW
jgi:SpoVK/Ycf46/Vps4 family AAA+-type ATPase